MNSQLQLNLLDSKSTFKKTALKQLVVVLNEDGLQHTFSLPVKPASMIMNIKNHFHVSY